MWWILLGIAVIFCIVITIQYNRDIKTAYNRLEDYDVKMMDTRFGVVSYVDEGKGETILIAHGIFGGYDQGYASLASLVGNNYRKIAVSRFGYPGTELPDDPAPANQAASYAELLDNLGIGRVYILATSAGGAAGLRFVLDHPEKTKGLILLSSGAPDKQRSKTELKELGMTGPPAVIVHDFPMWFVMKYFGFIFNSMMGAGADSHELLQMILPVAPRRQGIIADTNITNVDMTLHYDEYVLEDIKPPILVLHAKDDPMAPFENIEALLARVNAETAVFKTGGHLLSGNDGLTKIIEDFIEKTR